MTLQLEEGKFYWTRDGRKVGPMKRHTVNSDAWLGKTDDGDDVSYYAPDGKYEPNGKGLSIVGVETDGRIVPVQPAPPAPPAHDPPIAPAMTIQQARIEALRMALTRMNPEYVAADLETVERLARFIVEGVK